MGRFGSMMGNVIWAGKSDTLYETIPFRRLQKVINEKDRCDALLPLKCFLAVVVLKLVKDSL
jgi:hypothetical protein